MVRLLGNCINFVGSFLLRVDDLQGFTGALQVEELLHSRQNLCSFSMVTIEAIYFPLWVRFNVLIKAEWLNTGGAHVGTGERTGALRRCSGPPGSPVAHTFFA